MWQFINPLPLNKHCIIWGSLSEDDRPQKWCHTKSNCFMFGTFKWVPIVIQRAPKLQEIKLWGLNEKCAQMPYPTIYFCAYVSGYACVSSRYLTLKIIKKLHNLHILLLLKDDINKGLWFYKDGLRSPTTPPPRSRSNSLSPSPIGKDCSINWILEFLDSN